MKKVERLSEIKLPLSTFKRKKKEERSYFMLSLGGLSGYQGSNGLTAQGTDQGF